MSPYPLTVTIDAVEYKYERILKDDFFSVNAFYRAHDGRGMVLKVSDFRFIGGFLLRPIASYMSRHELRMYRKLSDISGIPKAGPTWGWRGFYHEYAEGETLHALDHGRGTVPEAFFEHLLTMMQAIHAHNIIYLDSNKRGNIIVGPDGLPRMIDFQISINFGWSRPIFGWLFNILAKEDIYHVYKHKRHFGHPLTPEEAKLSERSKVNKMVGGGIGKPYKWLKRKIYPSGGNDVIWYKRKKGKELPPAD
jgi:hypothetical protein